jgi:LacI family transcriptional regulator
MLTNKEIAEILHISPAAVSLALNNKPGVSEKTRRKVLALRNGSVAAEYNDMQQRRLNASELLLIVQKKHGDVICDTPFFMVLSETLHQQAALEGYWLQVIYTKPNEPLHSYCPPTIMDRYDGVLILGTEAAEEDIAQVLSYKKPTVVIDAWFECQNVDCVLMDNETGIRQAVRYAFMCGHKRIGFVGSYVHARNFEERELAYYSELQSLGLLIQKKYIHHIHSTVDGANTDMQAILRSKPSLPSVFICANDLIAMGVIDALSVYGYRIPQDVSVIGFDDMSVSAHLNPPLTSVSFDTRKIARMAVRTLAERISGGESQNGTSVRCLIAAKLQTRKSVCSLAESELEINN